jgi:hypothetical protein
MVASPDGYPENCECLHEDAILDELNQVAENSLALLTII